MLLLTALFFFSGAVGMDYLGGRYADLYSKSTLIYGIMTTIEEGLEMIGSIVFIYAILSYMRLHIPLKSSTDSGHAVQ